MTATITAREIALHILKAVEADGAYANLALNRALEAYRPTKLDRAFATELAYGTLRTLNTLDWITARFLKQPLGAQTVWIRNILRLGVYQLFYMDKVPPGAACNEAVELAKKFGTPGAVRFVNGVLRNIARQKDQISGVSGGPGGPHQSEVLPSHLDGGTVADRVRAGKHRGPVPGQQHHTAQYRPDEHP